MIQIPRNTSKNQSFKSENNFGEDFSNICKIPAVKAFSSERVLHVHASIKSYPGTSVLLTWQKAKLFSRSGAPYPAKCIFPRSVKFQ